MLPNHKITSILTEYILFRRDFIKMTFIAFLNPEGLLYLPVL